MNSANQNRELFAQAEKDRTENGSRFLPATEEEYLDCIRHLKPDVQNVIESIDGPTAEQLADQKIAAARRMWNSLPHEVKVKIAFSAPQVPNPKQNAA